MSMPAFERISVGTWQSPGHISGCTVVVAPDGACGALAIRGAAPGTREAAALSPQGKVSVCHAVVLAGGSAFGLATADGVMRWLEARGVGYPVGGGVVPIVGAAIVLDAAAARAGERPDAHAGEAACNGAIPLARLLAGRQPRSARDAGPVRGAGMEPTPLDGRIGAGTGCTVAKVAGLEYRQYGGQAVGYRRHAEVEVVAIVANNALGEVFDADGTPIAVARAQDDAPRYPTVSMDAVRQESPLATIDDAETESGHGPTLNTVVGCVVTNASLSKAEAYRVADLAHSGIARSVRPAHTDFDGDALFSLATGSVRGSVDLVASLAADAVADAIRLAPIVSA